MSDFPHHQHNRDGILLSELARRLGVGVSGDRADPLIRRIAPVAEAGEDALGLVARRGYLDRAYSSGAAALLVSQPLEAALSEEDSRPRLVVPDAHQALPTLLEALSPQTPTPPGQIHPSAVIDPTAELGEDVCISAFVVVEEGASIGPGSVIGAHAVVGARVRMGAGCRIFPHAVLYPGAILGDRVIIHSGARIAVDGFGYVSGESGLQKIPQVGQCILGDDVEIGANTTLDRGSIGQTRIGAGTKIDNLVQVGHNVHIGAHTVLAAQVGVAGSSSIGSGVEVGGQAGVAGHLHVGDGARLAARSGTIRSVGPGETVMGFPARPRQEFLRSMASLRRVPNLVKRIRVLESELETLSDLGVREEDPDDDSDIS